MSFPQAKGSVGCSRQREARKGTAPAWGGSKLEIRLGNGLGPVGDGPACVRERGSPRGLQGEGGDGGRLLRMSGCGAAASPRREERAGLSAHVRPSGRRCSFTGGAASPLEAQPVREAVHIFSARRRPWDVGRMGAGK